MEKLTLPSGVVITLQDSPRLLPESRRVECDYYNLIDSALGSTLSDADRHFEPLSQLIAAGEVESALTGLSNLRLLINGIYEKQVSVRSLALACLVDTVDEKPWTDYSPEGVEQLSRLLSEHGLTDELVAESLPLVKKN